MKNKESILTILKKYFNDGKEHFFTVNSLYDILTSKKLLSKKVGVKTFSSAISVFYNNKKLEKELTITRDKSSKDKSFEYTVKPRKASKSLPKKNNNEDQVINSKKSTLKFGLSEDDIREIENMDADPLPKTEKPKKSEKELFSKLDEQSIRQIAAEEADRKIIEAVDCVFSSIVKLIENMITSNSD